jgi:hypothetical protein
MFLEALFLMFRTFYVHNSTSQWKTVFKSGKTSLHQVQNRERVVTFKEVLKSEKDYLSLKTVTFATTFGLDVTLCDS